jgi:hypothetical protein
MEYGYAKSSIEHSSSQAAIVPLAGSLLICLQNPSQASADFRLVGGLPLARHPILRKCRKANQVLAKSDRARIFPGKRERLI